MRVQVSLPGPSNKMILSSLPKDKYPDDKRSYINLGAFRVQDILPLIDDSSKVTLYGFNNEPYKVKVHSHRLHVFKKNIKCVACPREGSIFLLQASRSVLRKLSRDNCPVEDCSWCYYSFMNTQHMESPHLNLWHQDSDGSYGLMTKDHIIPKSKGGKDELSNLQTMCRICNNKKGDS